MATFPESQHSVVPGLAACSYLAHRGAPTQVYRDILSFLNLFETLYSSTEGSLLCFAESTDVDALTGLPPIVPVRQASDKSAEQCRRIESMHAGAMAFAAEYRDHLFMQELPLMLPEVAAEFIFRVIRSPTTEEAELLGQLVHCDNLGSTSQHVAAIVRKTADPALMFQDYCDAHWKQGMISMATPQSAAMRTMVWLMQSQPAPN